VRGDGRGVGDGVANLGAGLSWGRWDGGGCSEGLVFQRGSVVSRIVQEDVQRCEKREHKGILRNLIFAYALQLWSGSC